MAARSLNKVLLIGNLVRDPEIRYTPQNTAVANFSIATNRTWTDPNGQVQESVEYTRVVAWGKLAEILEKIAHKGRKVFVEGRLQTRAWETKDGEQRKTTEVVAEQVIMLDAPRGAEEADGDGELSAPTGRSQKPARGAAVDKDQKDQDKLQVEDSVGGDDLADDIPF